MNRRRIAALLRQLADEIERDAPHFAAAPDVPRVVTHPLPNYVTVKDVMESLQCSRATAYEHMRRALRRRPGDEKGIARVEEKVWKAYAADRFGPKVRKPHEGINLSEQLLLPPRRGRRAGVAPR